MTSTAAIVPVSLWTRGGKRVFDILASVLLLILLSPLLILAGLLVKLTSRGPMFFTQTRSGKNGAPFTIIKFRTMRGDRTPDPKELVPLEHPEITPLGWYLRRFKIDELPQLLCVFTGKMSLVGPRPTLPDQVAKYDEFRRQRLLVRPGITGLAQVNTTAATPWDERILYDVAYVRHCGVVMDMKVLARTIGAIFVGDRERVRPFGQSTYATSVLPPVGYGAGE